MKTYSVTKTINASADTIWAILTDSSKYPDWNETVGKIEGNIALGEQLKVYSKNNPDQVFPVKVVDFEPGKKMIWRGGMPLGLFVGARTFLLSGDSHGPMEFYMEEKFSGLMSPLITRSIPDLTPYFEQFALNLKDKAENYK
ncbi:SRPBCC domain-containing protein [Leptolyngbyaceae cyanobacterium CCMR0082]|uniref:SRPBCC domain-containing protein n=2 Tax=Adonisia turfae TaxID=2950184 RepID=A0A6M0S127_9CYAN|nr:SRPBCC domain-containing protein [Adonisia turfae]NEZ60444.1 SRPBCC domain-containing protein [Adonisia turfae CCMR0081]NEZ62164.1 SRPBCC domain-containing protein [Adonisia turfae CCMR0082]